MKSRHTLGFRRVVPLFVFGCCTAACSSSSNPGSSEVGGTTATGGSAHLNGGASSIISSSGGTNAAGGADTSGGTVSTGGHTSSNSSSVTNLGGALASGGSVGLGGAPTSGGVGGTSTTKATGGASPTGGKSATGSTTATGGARTTGGASTTTATSSTGGISSTGGTRSSSSTTTAGGSVNTGGSTTSGGAGGCASGPVGTISGELATGVKFMDTDGKPVNAHGGGIIKEGDTYYLHGEYFLSTTTDNNFNGFSMYSSKDLATWKNEGIILPQQASGELGPNRKGERPHIIKCPSTGEFVLYAHAASEDYQTDKEVVYATSTTVNGQYAYKGPLTNSSGAKAVHSDMSAFADVDTAYVLTESGHVYTLAADCHSWLTDKSYSAVNGDSGGSESPTVFKAGSTYYWIGSYKTGWRANNNFYSTAPAMAGPWTYQGFVAPVSDTSTTTPSGSPNPPEWISDERTWLSQSTWVMPVVGCKGTTYVYLGDHWYGTESTSNPGKHNDQATYVLQPLVFDGTKISMPEYHVTWKLDVGAGTWSQ